MFVGQPQLKSHKLNGNKQKMEDWTMLAYSSNSRTATKNKQIGQNQAELDISYRPLGPNNRGIQGHQVMGIQREIQWLKLYMAVDSMFKSYCPFFDIGGIHQGFSPHPLEVMMYYRNNALGSRSKYASFIFYFSKDCL